MCESDEQTAMIGLARSLVQAAERDRGEDIAANFDPEAVIWHNTDELTLTMAANFPPSAAFMAKVPHRRYEDLRVMPFDGGFVQQHRIVGRTDTDASFTLPACAVMRVLNGRIVSIHEYFDSAPIARLGIASWLPRG